MTKHYCKGCGEELVPKNDMAKTLIRQGRLTKCPKCRQRGLDYANMPYDLYLTTETWKMKAEACKMAAGNRCQVCNATGPLDAHHRTYVRRGYEHPSDLTALCRRCHELVKGIEVY